MQLKASLPPDLGLRKSPLIILGTLLVKRLKAEIESTSLFFVFHPFSWVVSISWKVNAIRTSINYYYNIISWHLTFSGGIFAANQNLVVVRLPPWLRCMNRKVGGWAARDLWSSSLLAISLPFPFPSEPLQPTTRQMLNRSLYLSTHAYFFIILGSRKGSGCGPLLMGERRSAVYIWRRKHVFAVFLSFNKTSSSHHTLLELHQSRCSHLGHPSLKMHLLSFLDPAASIAPTPSRDAILWQNGKMWGNFPSGIPQFTLIPNHF